MKKYLIILLLATTTLHLFAQEADENQSVDELIKIGIEQYDAKEYKQSIETFQKALEVEPSSMIATYELALSYLAIKDYENASKI